MSSALESSSSPSPPSTTPNTTAGPAEWDGSLAYPMWAVVIILILCSIMIIGTILGNILVCMAVSIVRKLRTLSNWLIVSLAVADLCVATFVMPFAAITQVTGPHWIMGQAMCDMWTSLDVLLCTSSILNLCTISIDRYFVITKPFQYAIKRKPVHMILMIMAVWTLSAIISIAPLMGWKRAQSEGRCEPNPEISYQFFATIGAFYLPLTVMIIIYYRIYVVSSRITRAEAKNKSFSERESTSHGSSLFGRRKSSLAGEAGAGKGSRGSDAAPAQYGRSSGVSFGNNHLGSETSRQNSDDATSHSKVPLTARKSIGGFLHRGGSSASTMGRNSSASKSERKATKTLGVIMGAFTFCWLPFFILALVKSIMTYNDVDPNVIPHWIESCLLWLGYANSFFNPIIYARFNRDFRTPFKEILLCRCRGINIRLRSESYTEQFGPLTSERRTSMGRPPSGASLLQKPATESDTLLKPPLYPNIIVEDDAFHAPRPGNSENHNNSGGKSYNSTLGSNPEADDKSHNNAVNESALKELSNGNHDNLISTDNSRTEALTASS